MKMDAHALNVDEHVHTSLDRKRLLYPNRGFCLTVYKLCFVLRELVIVTKSKY